METRIVNGVGLAYLTAGDEAGRKALIIHGLTASAREWRLTARMLASAGWRVLSIDNPGHGASSAPQEAPDYAGAAVADLLHALAVELGFVPTVVIGHSWGGLIAEEYAIRHEGDVAALILVASGGGAPRTYPRPNARVAGLYEREAEVALSQGMEALWRFHQDEHLWADARALPAAARAAQKARFLQTSPRGYVYGNRSLGVRRDTLADLARLKVPALVMCGEHEDPQLSATSRGLAAAIPGARLQIIGGAGHSPHIERARAFNAVLLAFLDGV